MVYRINGKLDNVRFAKIEGYNNYLICGSGAVYSLKGKKARKMKPYDDGRGYLQIDLCKDSVRKHCKIHRLVAQAFISNPNGFRDVDHIDGNKKNNCISNLQWLSHRDNIRKYYGMELKDIQEV